ncbi:hypothetical protein H8356DRAFT_1421737 [Neocallimastix lanati (nom. inval.)]|nr:hypothetical protein H8356DRAFT_1421737 [Neocallimastix sp. JGI-2020a]
MKNSYEVFKLELDCAELGEYVEKDIIIFIKATTTKYNDGRGKNQKAPNDQFKSNKFHKKISYKLIMLLKERYHNDELIKTTKLYKKLENIRTRNDKEEIYTFQNLYIVLFKKIVFREDLLTERFNNFSFSTLKTLYPMTSNVEFSLIFKDKYLNDDELSKVLKDPEYILYKNAVYNFKENKLRFERTERDIGVFEDIDGWMEDYHDLFYYTISSTSNAKFNKSNIVYAKTIEEYAEVLGPT